MLILSNVFRAGVTSLYKSLATEVASDNITVNTVLPGLTDTARLRQLYGFQAQAKKMSVDDFIGEVAGGLPLRRLNHPDELGRLTAYLCSDLASGITGCAFPVDGGSIKALM